MWTPAYDADDEIRDGAWVAELTGLLDLTGWPAGMRVIARKERPHPGAQLRLTDVDGLRITAFATNTPRGQLPDLELRHRRRARAEDRIRSAKDTGLTNLPLHDFTQNQIWCAIVALAAEITAWMQILALTDHPARRWEPKRLRLRLFTIPATLARTGRRGCCTSPSTTLGRPASTTPSTGSAPSPRPAAPRLTTATAVPTTRTTPDRGTRRPPETTLGELSHPHATITPQRPSTSRPDTHRQPDERSGLGPDVFLSNSAVAPLGNSYHAAPAFELADDTGPVPGSKGDRVGCDLRGRASR